MIELRGVTKTYRSEFLRRLRPVLRGVDLVVRRGETYALLGANGEGKTTIMKIVLDLIRPDRGEVIVDGLPASDPKARRRVAFLPEHPYFFPHLTGEELVVYYGRLSGLGGREAAEKAGRWLDRVRIGEARRRPVRTYSKGMLQRVGFAQALVSDPELLVLDEPLSGLDPVGRREMRDLIGELKDRGATIFLTSHILEDVERLSDRAGFLADGRIRREVEGRETGRLEVHVAGLDVEAVRLGELDAQRIALSGEHVLVSLGSEEELPRLSETLRTRGGRILKVEPRRESLEEIFIEHVRAREEEREPA
ncbi:MAG: ABC transporter ATP-binding protein [Candidatus Eisenbacteria bacterium]